MNTPSARNALLTPRAPRKQMSRVRAASSGVTLIELMVALAISLVVLFAVTSVYVSTRTNTRLQAGMARVNEASQVASEILARDIRQLGSAGCPSVSRVTLSQDSPNAVGASSITINRGTSTRIIEAGGTGAPVNAVAGTAVIEVMHAAEQGAHVAASTADRGDPLTVSGDPGFENIVAPNYPLAIVSGCHEGEVFRVARVLKNPWRVDPFEPLRARYGPDARVAPVSRTQYFLAPATRVADERSTRAIYVRRAAKDGLTWLPAQPLVHDVDAINVTLHLDTDGDFQADSSQPFASSVDPMRVVGYTLELVVNAPKQATAGSTVKRPTTSTINIRNRVI